MSVSIVYVLIIRLLHQSFKYLYECFLYFMIILFVFNQNFDFSFSVLIVFMIYFIKKEHLMYTKHTKRSF